MENDKLEQTPVSGGSPLDGGLDLAEQIAANVFLEWHPGMPAYSWDLKGYALAVAKAAIDAEREACAKICREVAITELTIFSEEAAAAADKCNRYIMMQSKAELSPPTVRQTKLPTAKRRLE